jgi:hypothetical protein
VYATAYLAKTQIETAYALLAAFAPDISPLAWRRFCELAAAPLGDGPRVAVVTDPLRRLRALSILQPAGGPVGERWLDVPVFAPFTAADPRGVTRVLLGFLEDAARSASRTEIRFGSLQPADWGRFIAGERTWSAGRTVRMVID